MRTLHCCVVGLLGLQPLVAQSALGQLETMTGQKVQRFQGSSTYRYDRTKASTVRSVKIPIPTPDQRAASLLAGMFGGMLSQALSSGSSGGGGTQLHDERQAGLEARLAQMRQEAMQRDQRALQVWAQDYAAQLNQRLLAPQGQSAEGTVAAQSGYWDGAARTGGDSMVVDLRDARALAPGNLKAADPAPPKSVTPEELLQHRAEAQARLQRMMAENGNMKVLGQRFYELEDQLSRLKLEAVRLGADGRELMREHEGWGAQVDRAVQNSLERGASLLTGTIVPEGTADGFKTLRADPKVWNGTLESLSHVNDFTEFLTERGDRVLAAREAVDWVQAKRNLYKDLDFIASNLQQVSPAWKAVGMQWELGKSIVGSGLDVAQELDAWGNMKGAAGDQQLLKLRQRALQGRMSALVDQLKASRGVIAARLGVRPEDLIPVQAGPKGLGSAVPPI
jgi:hypothetical protein